jgi:NADPH:quinone reductase-like Zn-dependent oxidoreductase
MKAVVYNKYGPPEVAQLKEVDKPIPKSNEILVKVHASTVNRTDAGFRSAKYFISRFWTGLLRPKYPILGCEFAGIVEDTGKDVSQFKVGDRVFGFNDRTCGGHGEYLCIGAQDGVALMPENFSFYEAAPLAEGSHYALINIRASKISKGQNALVYGATGAIGTAAVQLLKHFGVKVTAVGNTKNMSLIKNLGADDVIDYQSHDFTQTPKKFEFIFDAVGKSSFAACKPLLTKNGIYISTELGKNSQNVLLALVTPFLGGKKVLFPIPSIQQEDLIFLSDLAKKGEFKPVIDRSYHLEEIVEAYRYVETGQKTGNVVIKVVPS